ncbi:hypothetical protein [Prosthecobacter sp.]|uniref:hypothetical protein n=1 Tax=Prosthecobacter sp. TaxID=1965333 RepID=UPI00378366F4
MYCEIEFGKHRGRSYEWIFFNDPSYATWLYENKVIKRRQDLDPYEKDYFEELYARASCLAGICEVCKAKPITRKAFYFDMGKCISHLFCETCKVPGLSRDYYSNPSMLDFGPWTTQYQPKVFRSLADKYTDQQRDYSQEEMEAFFRCDANFRNSTPNFFEEWEKEVEKL